MSAARLSLILLVLGTGVFPARGQDLYGEQSGAVPDSVVQRVATAFADGNAKRLLGPAADRVEVSLLGTRTFYSSAQAFYVLRDFFDAHPPGAFTLSDVTAAGRSCFVRGRIDDVQDERTLQVYVRLVQRRETWQLHEIRIDADLE